MIETLPESGMASGLRFEKLSWDGGWVGPVEVAISTLPDSEVPVLSLSAAPFSWHVDGVGSGNVELEISTSHLGVSRTSAYSVKFQATGQLNVGDGPAKYVEIRLSSSKSVDSPNAPVDLTILLADNRPQAADVSVDGENAIMQMSAGGNLEFSQSGISSANGFWKWQQNGPVSPEVFSGKWMIRQDIPGGLHWKLDGEFREDLSPSPSPSLQMESDDADEDGAIPPIFRQMEIGGMIGQGSADTPDLEITVKLTDLTIPRLASFENLDLRLGFRKQESTEATRDKELPMMDRLFETGSFLDAIELSINSGYFEIADYWKGEKLTIQYTPDGRELSISAPDSALHWEYFDRIELSGKFEKPAAALNLNLENETISIASQANIVRKTNAVGRETAVDIHEIRMHFDDTYGLSGMYPDLPNFVTSAIIEGKASLVVPDQPDISPSWGVEMRIDGDELGFPDLSITLESIQSSFRAASPPTGHPNSLPLVTGHMDIEKVEIPEVEISPIRIVFSEDENQEQYVTLKEAKVFGGVFSSSPIYLGKAPDKVAAHFNVHDLDGHQITRMIKDFNGSLEGKLNGQLAIQWNNPKLRFQYGHFYLNNPDESRLQWDADGILTKQMNPGQWTYKKSREMEAAISHLNIREMNVFVTNQSDRQDLMKVFMNGVPIDGSLKNPVHLNFNLKGRWQSLIDYLFKGSGMKLDFSIN